MKEPQSRTDWSLLKHTENYGIPYSIKLAILLYFQRNHYAG